MSAHTEKDMARACALLEAKEYTEHWAETPLGKRLEAALTELHNDAQIQRDILHAVAEAAFDEAVAWMEGGQKGDPVGPVTLVDRIMAERGAA